MARAEASRWAGRCPLDREDLEQEAAMALVLCERVYDQTRGAFPSFASVVIRRDLGKAAAREASQRTVRSSRARDLHAPTAAEITARPAADPGYRAEEDEAPDPMCDGDHDSWDVLCADDGEQAARAEAGAMASPLRRALDALPPDLREVACLMVGIDGPRMRGAQIARMRGTNEMAVSRLWHEALRELRREML